ncbi:MAG: rhamnogalacturonan acetylesterase [Flavisolibacter sp.]
MGTFPFLILSILFFSFTLPAKKKIKLFMAGDSTMAIKSTKNYPETGWGMPFVYMFDSTVKVDNRAKNGRSTKSFITEGLWDALINDVKEDDYVFIQFGHNDEVPSKGEKVYSTPERYSENLTRFVNETRAKEAFPVLLTSVSRRKFDSMGKALPTHGVYPDVVRSLAKEMNVPLIDHDKKSLELLQQFGIEKSKLLFLQLQPGEHPNYPKGKDDNTHFNELGARLMAQIVVNEIKNIQLELADRIVNSGKKL